MTQETGTSVRKRTVPIVLRTTEGPVRIDEAAKNGTVVVKMPPSIPAPAFLAINRQTSKWGMAFRNTIPASGRYRKYVYGVSCVSRVKDNGGPQRSVAEAIKIVLSDAASQLLLPDEIEEAEEADDEIELMRAAAA